MITAVYNNRGQQPPITISPCGTAALHPHDLSPLARRIADRAAVSDIELFAQEHRLDGVLWYDLRPMLSEDEHSPEFIDMAREALQYATARRLATLHPAYPHLLRLNLAALEAAMRGDQA